MFENEGDFCEDRERCFPVQAEAKIIREYRTEVFRQQQGLTKSSVWPTEVFSLQQCFASFWQTKVLQAERNECNNYNFVLKLSLPVMKSVKQMKLSS